MRIHEGTMVERMVMISPSNLSLSLSTLPLNVVNQRKERDDIMRLGFREEQS